MPHGRKRLVEAVLTLALVVAVTLVPSVPTYAEPDIDDVQARVDRLYHEAEQASERLNDAKIELAELRSDTTSLDADLQRQESRLEAVRKDLQDSIVSQYEGQNLSAVGQLAVADDAESFVSRVTTMSAYNDLQAQLFEDFSTEIKALEVRQRATERRAEDVARTMAQLAAEKETIQQRQAEAESLLGELKAKERQALLSRDSVRVPSGVATSGMAAPALAYAMAQVGKAYVWGAAGPSAFDCSGLTMMAWAQAGVSLPHSSSAQFSSGRRVAASDLQPGDLVFYYSPISHVEMYIGDGLIVGAANPGAGVRVSELSSMPYVGAVRPG